MAKEPCVDLHLHTTASDGSLSPVELIHCAYRAGLAAIAITDHDSTDALDAASREATRVGLEFIPGVELSTDVDDSEVHILGYFIDYRHARFQETLAMLRESRYGRARQMLDKLAALGMPLEWERVAHFAGDGTIGRPHVAKAMVEKGYVPDVKTAFDLYIGRHGPAYVERYKMTPTEAVRLIRSVDGVPVLAHPLEGDGSLRLLPELVTAGLTGLEVYYTGYTPEQVHLLEETAHHYHLLTTGGSDYHGGGVMTEAVIGQPPVPYRVVVDLRMRHVQSIVG